MTTLDCSGTEAKKSRRVINVVIVESHQHVLEHIHSVQRKQKILSKPWTMVHFDAHPDLACPTAPAIACFTPRHSLQIDPKTLEEKNLYELLDSTSSGIAEWILPLVLAAALRVVEWVKPSSFCCEQLPKGLHRYQVGAFDASQGRKESIESFTDLSSSAVIKVDWEHPYYWDDNSTVSSNQLLLSQLLELHVTELEDTHHFASLQGEEMKTWCLDICLDYFSCVNPYLVDIDEIDPNITDVLVVVMQTMHLYGAVDNNQPSRFRYLKDLMRFRSLLKAFLTASTPKVAQIRLDELVTFYESKDEGNKSLLKLKDLLNRSDNGDVCKLVLDAVPCWNMPHVRTDQLDLEQIENSLRNMKQAILKHHDTHAQPFLITLARSSEDGFTPTRDVEDIQDRVLTMLHSTFCGTTNCKSEGSKCCLRITRDYGEWEGSTIF